MTMTSLLYSDSLVEIDGDSLCFKSYYFPCGGAKCVCFADIDKVISEKPSLHNGQWRIWGSGDLYTWFPLDWQRPTRSAIFFVSLRGTARRIGFTVEDAEQVGQILPDKCLPDKCLFIPAATESTRPAR